MHKNTADDYIKFITPTRGDPTYSLLKAHLLFEELLRAFLTKNLPNPQALEGSRLTFSQLLAIVRAFSSAPQDHWCWAAVAKLNKLRNMLSHEAAPKALSEKIHEYVSFVTAQSGVPLPAPPSLTDSATDNSLEPGYISVDVVTMALYYVFADRLGFDAMKALRESDSHSRSLRSLLNSPSDQGAA